MPIRYNPFFDAFIFKRHVYSADIKPIKNIEKVQALDFRDILLLEGDLFSIQYAGSGLATGSSYYLFRIPSSVNLVMHITGQAILDSYVAIWEAVTFSDPGVVLVPPELTVHNRVIQQSETQVSRSPTVTDFGVEAFHRQLGVGTNVNKPSAIPPLDEIFVLDNQYDYLVEVYNGSTSNEFAVEFHWGELTSEQATVDPSLLLEGEQNKQVNELFQKFQRGELLDGSGKVVTDPEVAMQMALALL